MSQDPLDHGRLLNQRDEAQSPTATRTGQDVEAKRPSHQPAGPEVHIVENPPEPRPARSPPRPFAATAEQFLDVPNATRSFDGSPIRGASCADPGYLACERHDYAAARTWFTDALHTFGTIDHQRGIAYVLEGLAVLAALEGDGERALMLGGAAATLRKTARTAGRQREEALFEGALGRPRHGHDPSRASSVWDSRLGAHARRRDRSRVDAADGTALVY